MLNPYELPSQAFRELVLGDRVASSKKPVLPSRLLVRPLRERRTHPPQADKILSPRPHAPAD